MAIVNPTNPSMTAIEWGLLICLSILWGGSFFFVGLAVRELPAFTIVTLRVALAAMVLLTLMRMQRLEIPCRLQVWGAVLGMGLLNNAIPFSLLVWGQKHIATGVASILNATTPLFGVVVAHYLTSDEKMTGGRLVGVLIGVLGVAIMIGQAGFKSGGVTLVAQLGCVAAAISYAFAGVFGRRFKAMGVAPLATATGMLMCSSLVLLPVTLIGDQPWTLPMPSLRAALAVLGLAVLSTALAYILYFLLLASAGATNLLLVTLLIPVSAVLLGILLLGETLLTKHVAGMLLIGVGLACIDGRPWRALLRIGRARAPD